MSDPIELADPIAVDTPLGRGYAIIFESTADDNFWTVAMSDTRALVTFRQKQIRVARQYTYRRDITDVQMMEIISNERKEGRKD